MPPLVQICVVIVTLAFVTLVVSTILALFRLGQAAARLTSAAQIAMLQVEVVVKESQELMVSLREIMPPAQRVVSRFQKLGDRAADLSNAVLDEFEGPVLGAVAVARGVKTGTAQLFDLLVHRFAPRSSSSNGDDHHE